jgi:F-type H+-transporting ATPase subunit epsilon
MAIRCVVVTPERTELDREAAFVTLPMYDGELGIGLHHSAMIGRLGYGVLRLQTATGTERLFVDGGFAQVEANVVSVLTGRALPLDQLDAAEAEQALEAAIALPGNTEDQRSLRETSILRARGMRRAARR